MKVGDEALSMRDACEVVAAREDVPLKVETGAQGAHFMVIEMKSE